MAHLQDLRRALVQFPPSSVISYLSLCFIPVSVPVWISVSFSLCLLPLCPSPPASLSISRSHLPHPFPFIFLLFIFPLLSYLLLCFSISESLHPFLSLFFSVPVFVSLSASLISDLHPHLITSPPYPSACLSWLDLPALPAQQRLSPGHVLCAWRNQGLVARNSGTRGLGRNQVKGEVRWSSAWE